MSPWAVTASATVQTAIIGSAVLMSVIQIQTIDVRGYIDGPPLVAPRAPAPEVRVVATDRTGAGTSAQVVLSSVPRRVFTEPSRIPTGVPRIIDDPATAPTSASVGPGYAGGVPDGVPFGVATAPAATPPPAPHVRRDVAGPPKPVPIGGKVLEARRINNVLPAYPILARQARIHGTVRLSAVIGADGRVKNLQVIEGHPLLIKAAIDAVNQWLYHPTMLNGVPVDVSAPIEVRFILNQ